MNYSAPRATHAEALDVLLRGEMSRLVVEKNWKLLEEVARLAHNDAPHDLAITDPSLFQAWRNAVTRYHLAGWGRMTAERVREETAGA